MRRERVCVAENGEQTGSAMIHGKLVEVVNEPGVGLMLKVDGEIVPYQRRVIVDSGMEETTIEVELVYFPTGGSIHLTGYLIDEAQWKRLQSTRLIDEDDWQLLQEAKRKQYEKFLTPKTPGQRAGGGAV